MNGYCKVTNFRPVSQKILQLANFAASGIISLEIMQLSGKISQIRLGNNAAARKFCRSVKQQKKKDSACVSDLCLSRLFNVVF